MRILYLWNAATDKIKATGVGSIFKQKLCSFSGLTKDEIDEEIGRREKLIESLAEKGIHSMSDVIIEFKKFTGEGKIGKKGALVEKSKKTVKEAK